MIAARRSLLMFALALMLPLAVAAAALEANSLAGKREALLRSAGDHAAFVAALVGRELAAHRRSMQMVAQSPAFDGPLDEARFRLLAARLVAEEPLWRTISVSDPAGNRLLDAPRPIVGGGGTVVEAGSHKAAVVSRRPAVGGVRRGPSGNAAFAVRAPVMRDGGPVTYVVSAVIEPRAMTALLLPKELPGGWAVQAIDDAGRIVATSDPKAGEVASMAPPVVRPMRGRGERTTRPDGEAAVAATAPVAGSPWSIRVSLPAAAYNAPLTGAILVLAGGGLVSLLMGGLLAMLLMRELQGQRREVAAAAERQRLEALGRLTGGVAHDFNNLLTPILGSLDLLARRLEGDPKARRLAEGALTSAERAKALVGRLLTFSRRQELVSRSVDLGALLRGLGDLIRHTAGPEVVVMIETAPDLPWAKVDPVQLELAVLNLAVNARDAMPSGGLLKLTAVRSSQPPPGLPPGDYARIAVADTGQGMDAATLERAVEPFFTTKGAGKGTGLGLSMVHGLAAQSGGALSLSSTSGAGTTAEIWLPAVARPEGETEPGEAPLDGRVGRLLLVDDDDLVRASTAAMLKDHGHTVVEAASAMEALGYLRTMAEIDALVTDFAMPAKSGAQLAAEARSLRDGLPVLIITGFAAADQLPTDVDVLGKPFRRDELLREVAKLLANRDEAAA